MTSARVEQGTVVSVERLGGGIIELSAELPALAAAATPGQFAQLRCGTSRIPLLRRPMSVAWTDGHRCSFVFEVVGRGTRILGDLRPGDALDVLGPLGTGFTLPERRGRVVCVSGGLGCAPFPALVRRLRAHGVADVIVINGAATADRLYPAARFQRGDERVRVVELTEDGSRGRPGRVTDAIPEFTRDADAVYACGPNPMLAALVSTLDREGITPSVSEASLEAPMGCGFGTCLGCALPARLGHGSSAWRLCCSEGPVMATAAIDWDALAALPRADVA